MCLRRRGEREKGGKSALYVMWGAIEVVIFFRRKCSGESKLLRGSLYALKFFLYLRGGSIVVVVLACCFRKGEDKFFEIRRATKKHVFGSRGLQFIEFERCICMYEYRKVYELFISRGGMSFLL